MPPFDLPRPSLPLARRRKRARFPGAAWRPLLAALAMALVFPAWGWAQANDKPKLERAFSYDTGLALANNRAYGNFGVEYEGALSLLSDGAQEINWLGGNRWGRFVMVLAQIPLYSYLNYPLQLAYHELGHASRCQAMGLDSYYTFDGAPDNHYRDFFGYFSAAFNNPYRGGVTYCSGFYDPAAVPADYAAIGTTLGGLNNQMYLADLLEEQIYLKGGHYTYLWAYTTAKLSAANYVAATRAGSFATAGDIENIANYYAAKGYNIGYGDIEGASRSSLYFSFTFWALLMGQGSFVASGQPQVNSLEVGPLRLPDLETYLTTQGLSYKIKSGLRWGSWFFPFGQERIEKGGQATENSFGVVWRGTAKDQPLELRAMGIGPNAEYALRWGFFTVGYNHYDIRSLHGERHTLDLTRGQTSSEAWARLSYTY